MEFFDANEAPDTSGSSFKGALSGISQTEMFLRLHVIKLMQDAVAEMKMVPDGFSAEACVCVNFSRHETTTCGQGGMSID